jgi:nucleoside-triphosphatase THEP1
VLESLICAELATLTNLLDVHILNEIGKMELHCESFVAAVRRLLECLLLVTTVARKGGGLIAEAKARHDVHLLNVTVENRHQLPNGLARLLCLMVIPKAGIWIRV